MSDEELEGTGWSRRKVLKTGAVAGGLVWAAPAVTTIGSRAIAQTASPRVQDISYVALTYSCAGVIFRVKWEVNQDGSLSQECGSNFETPGCPDLTGNTSELCGPATASFDSSTGNLTVDLGSCTLLAFRVKCGQGCETAAPEQNPGTTGSVVFEPCEVD